MLAELTVFLILALAPIVLFCFGYFQKLHLLYRSMLCLAAPVSMAIVWAISHVPYQITVIDHGIEARALLKKQKINWAEMLSLALTSAIGWRHYKLSLNVGELTFPYQLNNSAELVQEIRSHLPSRGRVLSGSTQTYKLPKGAHFLLLGKALLWLGFVIIFGSFFESLRGSGVTTSDLMLVLALEVALCLGVLWQLIYITLLPTKIEIGERSIKISGLIGKKEFSLSELKELAESKFPFPEGIKLKTDKKSFLVTSSIDNFDEFLEELNHRMVPKPKI